MNKQYSKDEMLEIIKEVNDKYGYVDDNNIDNFGKCRSYMYRRKFKSLNEAIELVGIDIKQNRQKKNEAHRKPIIPKWTDEYLLQRLRDYVIEFGKIPTTREIKCDSNYPNDEIYRKRFGNFKNALAKANIEIPKDKQWLYERKEYTKEELLEQFKFQVDKYLKETGKLLIDDDIDEIKEMPSAGCYYKKFKTLDNVYKAIGINRIEFNNDKLEDDMKQKYIAIRDMIGRTPHSRDIEHFSRTNDNYYSFSAYQYHFGSINKFQMLMGDKPTCWDKDVTDEDLLELLIILNNDLGYVPSQNDLKEYDYMPSLSIYVKRFGNYVEALKSAGLSPRSTNPELITPNGNIALSKLEYKFLLMLEEYNLTFKKEELYKDYIQGLDKRYRFDFTLDLNDNTYFIEIFGMEGFKEYTKRTKKKIKICQINNIPLIEFYEKDIKNKTTEEIHKLLLERINKISDDNLKHIYETSMS
jgi:hypothetical protein